jgi:hypothetical protein
MIALILPWSELAYTNTPQDGQPTDEIDWQFGRILAGGQQKNRQRAPGALAYVVVDDPNGTGPGGRVARLRGAALTLLLYSNLLIRGRGRCRWQRRK